MSPDFDAQAAFNQVNQRLDALQASQQEMRQVLLQTVDIQVGMLDSLRELRAEQQEMRAEQEKTRAEQQEMRADIRQLRDSHLTLLRVQNDMLDYMKFTFDQQAKWNERQDQFNIIFLDELRDLKREVRQQNTEARSIQDKMYQELKGRIERLEDSLNNQPGQAS